MYQDDEYSLFLLDSRSNGQDHQLHHPLSSSAPTLELSTTNRGLNQTSVSSQAAPDETAISRHQSKDTGSQTEAPLSRSLSIQENPADNSFVPVVKTVSNTTESEEVGGLYNHSRDAACQASGIGYSSNLMSNGSLIGFDDRENAMIPQRYPLSMQNAQPGHVREAWPAGRQIGPDIGIPLLRLEQTNQSAVNNANLTNTQPPGSGLFDYQSQTSGKPVFPLLRLPQGIDLQSYEPKEVQLFEIPRNPKPFPLLKMPESAKNDIPDLSKIKFFEIPKKPKDVRLLRMPETERSGVPDLSKIKFFEIPHRQEQPANYYPQQLLKMPANEAPPLHASKIMFAEQKTPASTVGWPLLHMTKPEEPPKFVSSQQLAEFERKKRKRQESPRHTTRDKENFRPSSTSRDPSNQHSGQPKQRPPSKQRSKLVENERQTLSR